MLFEFAYFSSEMSKGAVLGLIEHALVSLCPTSHVAQDGEGGGGGNPFSKLGDMQNFMKSVTEAQKLVQGQAQQIQAELAV